MLIPCKYPWLFPLWQSVLHKVSREDKLLKHSCKADVWEYSQGRRGEAKLKPAKIQSEVTTVWKCLGPLHRQELSLTTRLFAGQKRESTRTDVSAFPPLGGDLGWLGQALEAQECQKEKSKSCLKRAATCHSGLQDAFTPQLFCQLFTKKTFPSSVHLVCVKPH